MLRRYIVRQAFRKLGLSLKDVTRAHVEEVIRLFEKPVGKVVELPRMARAERAYRSVVIRKTERDGDEADALAGFSLELRVFPKEKNQKLPEKECTKWFDYDRIKGTVSLRCRTAGDIISTREGTHKKLKDWMIDEKIPKAKRDRIPLVADGEEVLWVPGYRRGESKKITDRTAMILEITVRAAGRDGE